MNHDTSFVTITQLAFELARTRRTIWRWIKTGRIPQPYRLGVTTFWNRDHLERFFARNAKASPTVVDRNLDGKLDLGPNRDILGGLPHFDRHDSRPDGIG